MTRSSSPPTAHPVYGLDIETDTTADGLDPAVAPIIAVAVATSDGDYVIDGDEVALLARLDRLLARLPPGVLVTWYGSGFDLPFIDARAHSLGVDIGLVVEPVPGDATVVGGWHGHRHLDAYRVYRNDLRRHLDVSCSLKSVSRLLGHPTVEVDLDRLHLLDRAALREYVASDARLARLAALRRWDTAAPFIDRVGPPTGRHAGQSAS
jgi:DNA polymerase elongation subunit (family B)